MITTDPMELEFMSLQDLKNLRTKLFAEASSGLVFDALRTICRVLGKHSEFVGDDRLWSNGEVWVRLDVRTGVVSVRLGSPNGRLVASGAQGDLLFVPGKWVNRALIYLVDADEALETAEMQRMLAERRKIIRALAPIEEVPQ